MIKHEVDLIVIEGMGRTLHTNLYAKMKCECLKLAVVKNRWLAKRLGGDMYAVICKYEKEVAKVDSQNRSSTTDQCTCEYLKKSSEKNEFSVSASIENHSIASNNAS